MKKIVWGIPIGLTLCAFFLIRNHVRLLMMRNIPVHHSEVVHIKTIDAANFSLDLYAIKRSYKNRWVSLSNSMFNDQIAVFEIPLKNYKFNNLVLPPVGNDKISADANLYFNTMIFDSSFIATRGVIDDKDLVNTKKPTKKRIGIDKNGLLTSFSENQNSRYNDVFQAPIALSQKSNGKINLRTLNYRQFISIKDGKLLFITGLNNSLISWIDVKALMPQLGLTSMIALDGGASVEYAFNGKTTNHYFSSIPFRHLWFRLNSPYYIEATRTDKLIN
jgi:hypothetical protein